MFLPPDYLKALNNPSLIEVILFLIKFQLITFIGVILNVLFMSGVVWWMLFFCRFTGIPWIDGTTSGFINRR